MNNLHSSVSENDPLAPFNATPDPQCGFCDITMELYDSGVNWSCFRCPECGETISDEPDSE